MRIKPRLKVASNPVGKISTFPLTGWASRRSLTCQPCRPSHYLDEAIAKCLRTWLRPDLRFIHCQRQCCPTDSLTCVSARAEMLIKQTRTRTGSHHGGQPSFWLVLSEEHWSQGDSCLKEHSAVSSPHQMAGTGSVAVQTDPLFSV